MKPKLLNNVLIFMKIKMKILEDLGVYKMFVYSFSQSNPEGIDFEIRFQHEKKFTNEEFQIICENAIVYALEKEYKKKGYACTSSPEMEYLCEFFKNEGFVYDIPVEQSYDFNPFMYEILKYLKTEKLLAWMRIFNKPMSNGYQFPKYFKKELKKDE
jgi:hypothetical protein